MSPAPPLVGAELRPPPFAMLSARRGREGGLDVRYSGGLSEAFVGVPEIGFVDSRLGRQLLPRILNLLDAAAEEMPVEHTFMLVDAQEELRALHCYLCRPRAIGADPVVGLLIHDLSARWSGGEREAVRSADLLLLLALAEVLVDAPPLEAGLARMVELVARGHGLLAAGVALLDTAGKPRRPALIAGSAVPARLVAGHLLPRRLLRRALQEQSLLQEPAVDGPAGFVLAVPLLLGREPLGVLQLCAAEDLAGDAWNREILLAYADYLSAMVAQDAAGRLPLRVEPLPPDSIDLGRLLTPRRQDVLHRLVEAGGTNREIGRALGLEEATVKVHMRHILRRLGVMRRTDAVNLVYSRGKCWLAARRAAVRHASPGPFFRPPEEP